MGNKPFRDKRDAEKGYRDSPLRLNADLRQTECWDGDSIRARRRIVLSGPSVLPRLPLSGPRNRRRQPAKTGIETPARGR